MKPETLRGLLLVARDVIVFDARQWELVEKLCDELDRLLLLVEALSTLQEDAAFFEPRIFANACKLSSRAREALE